MIKLFHCFGARPAHRVDAFVAADMLRASGCSYLAVNTHNIADVTRGDDLPVGYANATLGSVRALVGAELGITPVLNINHPATAAEAVARARRAVELTGVRVIKLEVLDQSQKVTRNYEVIKAAVELIGDGLEVWPLITADVEAFRQCERLGASMVRVMGSPIGARRGIDASAAGPIARILGEKSVPVMLDGGIGSVNDATEAFRLGFDCILVNSCLFAEGADPVAMLGEFRLATDKAAVAADAGR